MRATDTKNPTRQMPSRELPRKCGFGTEEIRKVMFEDINRGMTPIDKSMASQFINSEKGGQRRNQDF
jgi:hypothetical protein